MSNYDLAQYEYHLETGNWDIPTEPVQLEAEIWFNDTNFVVLVFRITDEPEPSVSLMEPLAEIELSVLEPVFHLLDSLPKETCEINLELYKYHIAKILEVYLFLNWETPANITLEDEELVLEKVWANIVEPVLLRSDIAFYPQPFPNKTLVVNAHTPFFKTNNISSLQNLEALATAYFRTTKKDVMQYFNHPPVPIRNIQAKGKIT